MPEPTTGHRDTTSPDYRVHVFLQRWDRGETLIENAGDALSYSTLAALLAAYDQLHRDLTALSIGISDQSKRAREADARAAAAEAAVQRVLDECDLGEFQARRWADPFPVPHWVEDVRAAVTGTTPEGGERFHDRLSRDQRSDVWDEIKARRASLPSGGALQPLPGGEPVHDHRGEGLPAELAWTAEDEADWRNRQRLRNSPVFAPSRTAELRAAMAREDQAQPFESVRESQFRTGLADGRRQAEPTQITNPSAPGFNPVGAVQAFMDGYERQRDADEAEGGVQ